MISEVLVETSFLNQLAMNLEQLNLSTVVFYRDVVIVVCVCLFWKLFAVVFLSNKQE